MSSSYTIYYSDSSKFSFPITVADDTKFNGVGTGNLTLVGRNYPAYGQSFAENFIHLLENAASPVPPINPIEGQLWFDTSDPTNKKLRINDGAANNTKWKPINGLFQQADTPDNASLGDVWVNTDLNQIKVFNGSSFQYPEWYNAITGTGSKDKVHVDIFGNEKNVVEIRSNAKLVAVISSNDQYTWQGYLPDDSDNPADTSGFNVIRPGINVSTLYKTYGTAEKAEALVVNNVAVSGSQFLRKDINQTFSGQLWLAQDSNALIVGSSKTFIIERSTSGVNANFINTFPEGQFTFNTKNSVGGNVISLLIDGSRQNVSIPTKTVATSTSTGALVVTGGAGIGENLHLGGSLYIANKIVAGNITGTAGQVLASDSNGVVRWSNFNSNGFTGGIVTGVLGTSDPTQSISTNSGAFQVVGGVGIGKNVNIGGDLSVVGNLAVDGILSNGTTITTTTFQTNQVLTTTNTASSTSKTTGALVVAGGAGIAENVWIGGNLDVAGTIYMNGVGLNTISGSTGTFDFLVVEGTGTGLAVTHNVTVGGNSSVSGNASVTGVLTATNIKATTLSVSAASTLTTLTVTGASTLTTVTVTSNSAATTTTNGALQVAGGVGIQGSLYVGGEIIANKLTIQLTTVTTTLVTTDDIISTLNTSNALTSVASGALQVAGGMSVVKDVYVGGNVYSTGGNPLVNFNTATLVSNAVSAERLTTPRTITLNGDVSGSFIFDGTQNTGTSITIQPNSVALGTDTVGDYISTGSTAGFGLSGSVTGEGTTFTVTSNGTSTNTASTLVYRNAFGNFTAGTITASTFSGSGVLLTNIPGGQITAGSVPNTALTSSTIGFAAGSAIGVSRTTAALGDTVTITNLGVQTVTGSAYLAVSASTGTVTITNNGVQTLTGTPALAVSASTGTVTLTNLGVTSAAGTTYLGVSASTGSITFTNLGVQTVTGSAYLSVSASTGTVTITNNGVQTVTGSAYLSVSASTGTVTITNNGVQTLTGTAALAVSSSTGTVTLTNLGVTSAVGSAYLSVSASTGTVTFTNNGVQTLTGTAALAVSASTGTVTLTNLGVTSAVGTTYLAVSASTGTVTFTNLGVQTVTGSAYLAVSASTGTVTITNNGVRTLTAGTDTSVSASTGTVTVWTTSTLQSVTSRGTQTNTLIGLTNPTQATSTLTGALVVVGGVGIGGNLWATQLKQTSNKITIGTNAGETTQSDYGIAIGNEAGRITQGFSAVAIGAFAGNTSQGTGTVAIGDSAGNAGQGSFSIAIGASAGDTNQPANSIIVNATGAPLNGTNTGTYIAPIRAAISTSTYGLYYNLSTAEITTSSYSVLRSISTTLVQTLGTNTATGATVYFTDLTPKKIGVFNGTSWTDALGTVLF